MPFPFLLAAGDPVTLAGVVTGLLGTSVVGGFFTFVFTRYGKKVDDAASAAKEAASNSAAVRTAEIASADKLEEAYRREIHRLIGEANERIVKLESRLAMTDEKVQLVNARNVHLYIYAERLQDRNQGLVRLIKKLNPDFDDSDFRPIDLSKLAPDTPLVQVQPAQVNISVVPVPAPSVVTPPARGARTMKGLTILKAALAFCAAAIPGLGAGMTADGGWHIAPVAVLGALGSGLVSLRAFLDKSVFTDGTPAAVVVKNTPADPVNTAETR